MTRRRGTAWPMVALLATGAASSGPALADQPLWELGLGVAGLRLPHYRGSDQSRTWLLPVPYAVYRGEIFKADREGARAVLLTSDRVDFDLSFSASAPTSNDDRARRGMPGLKPTLEFGPNLNLSLARARDWELQLRVPVRTVVTLQSRPRSVGFQAAPHLNLDWRVQDWNFGLQGGPLWGDRRRHAFFYDVAPIYATAERPAYTAHGGFAGWNSVASVSRRFAGTWAGMYLRADSLKGAVFEDSPLVKSRFNWSAGLALSWVLKTSEARVPDDDLPGSRP
ncbi:MAG: MipA/OmpV family protein [Pseudomonadota bacterium]|nr:MipA/OmpV family protein [Pseudomonadota bacterium]